MKKALSLILVLVMLLGMMPLTSFATEEEHTHTYENGICTGCGEKLSFEGHKEHLPELHKKAR